MIFCPQGISDWASLSGSVLQVEALSNCTLVDLVMSLVTPSFKWLKNLRPTPSHEDFVRCCRHFGHTFPV